MDEKRVTQIKHMLSMVIWFSATCDLYFCTRPHVTLIHLILRVYRFGVSLHVRMHIYLAQSACECMYVLALTYILRLAFRHYRRSYGGLHGFRTFFHSSWNFSSSTFYRSPFFHLADCFPKVLYFVLSRLRALFARNSPFARRER